MIKMKKDIKYYTNRNRDAWNEVMPKHQAASKERLDQLFSEPGYIYQKDDDLYVKVPLSFILGKKE